MIYSDKVLFKSTVIVKREVQNLILLFSLSSLCQTPPLSLPDSVCPSNLSKLDCR